MDWQQKADALNSLSRVEILMRGVNDWFVSQRVYIKDGGCLNGKYGNGTTPEAALVDHWRVLVDELHNGQYLVMNAISDSERKAVRWNGHMWETVVE